MTLDELKTIRRALGLLIPTNKMQARASSEALLILEREIKAAEQDSQFVSLTWTCKKCFWSHVESSSNCSNCGTPR